MTRLTIDELRAFLPNVEELRALEDHLIATSEADPARTWSGSGLLGTAGDRLVRVEGLAESVAALVDDDRAHRESVVEQVARAVQRLAAGAPEDAARHLLEAAALEESRDRPERAEAHADAAYRTAREGRDVELRGLALRRRARARWTLGRYAEAEADYRQAAGVADAASDPRGAAEASIGAGNVCEEQGRWDDAEEQYREALRRLDEVDGAAPERWHALLNLHVVHRSRGDLETSRPLLEEAEVVAGELNDETARPFLENARGQLEMAEGDFSEAARTLRRALDGRLNARSEVTIRLNLAEALVADGRALAAAEEARQAERRALTSRLPQKLPEVYRLLGRIASAEGNPDAFVLFERALELVEARGLPVLERAQTLQAYAESESRAGNHETAAQLHDQADHLYRTLGIEHRRRPWADRFDRRRNS